MLIDILRLFAFRDIEGKTSITGAPMREEREYQRVMLRKRLYFGVSDYDFMGFSEDISLPGIHVASQTILPIGTKILLGFGNDKMSIKFKVKGVVRWAVSPNAGDERQQLSHMGVKVTWHDEDYLRFLSDLIEERRLKSALKQERRDNIRYSERVEVIFEDTEEIMTQLTENISKGGLFVCTDKPLSKGVDVSLRIVIPHIMQDILAYGKVMYSIDLQAAKKLQRPPGMGILFVEFEYGHREIFEGFLRELAIKHGYSRSV